MEKNNYRTNNIRNIKKEKNLKLALRRPHEQTLHGIHFMTG